MAWSSSSSSSGVVVRTSHSHYRSRSYFQHDSDSSRRRCTPPPLSFYLVSAIHSTSRSRKQLAACSSHDDGFKEGLPRHDSIFTRRRDLSQGSGSRLGASSRWLIYLIVLLAEDDGVVSEALHTQLRRRQRHHHPHHPLRSPRTSSPCLPHSPSSLPCSEKF